MGKQSSYITNGCFLCIGLKCLFKNLIQAVTIASMFCQADKNYSFSLLNVIV